MPDHAREPKDDNHPISPQKPRLPDTLLELAGLFQGAKPD